MLGVENLKMTLKRFRICDGMTEESGRRRSRFRSKPFSIPAGSRTPSWSASDKDGSGGQVIRQFDGYLLDSAADDSRSCSSRRLSRFSSFAFSSRMNLSIFHVPNSSVLFPRLYLVLTLLAISSDSAPMEIAPSSMAV